jgi:hypothetical protein
MRSDRLIGPEAYVQSVNDETGLKQQWNVTRYTDFLGEWAELLAKESSAFLHELEEP